MVGNAADRPARHLHKVRELIFGSGLGRRVAELSVRVFERLPSVPAPATLELPRGVPSRLGSVPYEATTPTGAAILTALAERFEPNVGMIPRRVGHGVGSREGALPNLLRVVLECGIDDMSPELYPTLLERLLAVGARDAWIAPLVMKKGRAGILVSVLCDSRNEETMTSLLLMETTTLGVRRNGVSRTALERSMRSLQTPYGPVPAKVALQPDGTKRAKPQYEVCRTIALEQGLPLRELYRELERLLEEEADGE